MPVRPEGDFDPGRAGILCRVPENPEGALGDPVGHDPDHLQGQFRARSVLLLGGLPGLLSLQSSSTAGSPLVLFPSAIHADQDGEGPVFLRGEGKADRQGENHPVVAEGEEGASLGGRQGVMVHAGAPDVATGLARRSVIHGAHQDLWTERQPQVENTVAQIVQAPTGLAEEAVKGAGVLELRQLGGLNDAGQGAAPGTEDPSTTQGPEGTDQEIGHGGSLSVT